MKSVHIVLSWALKWRVRSCLQQGNRRIFEKNEESGPLLILLDPFLLVFLFFTDASGERLRTISNSRLGPALPLTSKQGGLLPLH